MKVLALDKDKTAVRSGSGSQYMNGADDQVLIEGVGALVDRYRQAGWTVVMVSNQGGVQYDKKTMSEAGREMTVAMNMFDPPIQFGAFAPSYDKDRPVGKVTLVEISPEGVGVLTEETSKEMTFRMPETGMLYRLTQTLRDSTGSDDKVEEVLVVSHFDCCKGMAEQVGCQFKWAVEWHQEALSVF